MLSLQSLVLFERGEIVAEPPQTLCSLPQSCRHAASPSSGTNPGYNRRRTLRSYLETRAGYLHFSKTHWTEAHRKGEEVRSVPEWQTLCHHGRDTLRLSTPRYETCMVLFLQIPAQSQVWRPDSNQVESSPRQCLKVMAS